MSTLLPRAHKVIATRQALDEVERLGHLLREYDGIAVELSLSDGTRISLGEESSRLLLLILQGLHSGRLMVESLPEELTTTLAAEFLGVSRPTLAKWIASGEIPSRKVGSHSRLMTSDVVKLRTQRVLERKQAFGRLRAFEEEALPIQR